jgi:hypothetical protein
METSTSPQGPWPFLYPHDAALRFWAALSKVANRRGPNSNRSPPSHGMSAYFDWPKARPCRRGRIISAQIFRSLAILWYHTYVPSRCVVVSCRMNVEPRRRYGRKSHVQCMTLDLDTFRLGPCQVQSRCMSLCLLSNRVSFLGVLVPRLRVERCTLYTLNLSNNRDEGEIGPTSNFTTLALTFDCCRHRRGSTEGVHR